MVGNGYATMQKETLSGRALEKEVFSRVTARLASVDLNAPGGHVAQAEALHENKALWITLACDLASPENSCPDDVRASLLGIASFVERHTGNCIAGNGDPEVLVAINRNIIAGLSGSPAQAA